MLLLAALKRSLAPDRLRCGHAYNSLTDKPPYKLYSVPQNSSLSNLPHSVNIQNGYARGAGFIPVSRENSARGSHPANDMVFVIVLLPKTGSKFIVDQATGKIKRRENG